MLREEAGVISYQPTSAITTVWRKFGSGAAF